MWKLGKLAAAAAMVLSLAVPSAHAQRFGYGGFYGPRFGYGFRGYGPFGFRGFYGPYGFRGYGFRPGFFYGYPGFRGYPYGYRPFYPYY